MKTPFKNTEFSFLLKRKLLISFLLFPSENKRNKTEISKKGNFLKMRNSGKNLKFYVLEKFSKNYLNFFVL